MYLWSGCRREGQPGRVLQLRAGARENGGQRVRGADDRLPRPQAEAGHPRVTARETVFYVPISQHAPQFATTAAALKQALRVAGLSLRVWDGNWNPAQVAACIKQAAGVRAGAIITDSIPYAMTLNPLVAAQAKNIPIMITDQAPDPAHPSNVLLGYLTGPGATQLTAVADWIIADSGGKAKVLINMSTDSPSTLAYVAAARLRSAGGYPCRCRRGP